MKGLCEKCGKREECFELCKKAEEYANQDYVEREEQLAIFNIENKEEETDYGVYDYFDEELNNRILNSRLRTAVINLYIDGKPTDEISYHVPFSLRHIQRIIKEFREKNDNI